MMKNLFKLLFLLALPLSLASCNKEVENVPHVSSITLNVEGGTVYLEPTQTFTLEALAFDKEGNKVEDVNFRFTSSNSNVASVGQDGIINALRPGATTITCIGEKQIASCLVKVSGSEIEDIYSLQLSPSSVIVKLGANYTPTVITEPEDARGIDLIWYSTEESVATVADGVITAVGLGDTTIKVVYGALMSEISVHVDEKGADVFTISLNESNKSLVIGNTFQLVANCSEQATITWESENDGIASVDKDGLVSANGKGTAVIKATANGVSASCTVHVSDGSEPSGDKNLQVFFYIDFNNVVEGEESCYKYLEWYTNTPFGSANKPADPAQAPDPAFSKFAGWSSHPIVDNIPEDLWDFEKDFVPDGTYVFVLYGIWIDD